MSESQKFPRARSERLVTRKVDKELLVYDLERDKAHCLNDTAARVWEYCDGQRSTAEISELLSKDLGTRVNEHIVWNALARLQKTQLLESPVVPPEILRQAGRREAVRAMA